MVQKILLAGLVLVVMTGCLVTVDSRESSGGASWSEEQLQRIEIGETDEQWISRRFGAPDRETSYEDGTKVWRYEDRRRGESEVSVFLLFNFDFERENTRILAVELQDGVVSDYWVEARD